MGATFPNGIASFRTHRDNVDDVSASDINKIQDELVAVQESLGEALNSIQVIETEIVQIDTEIDNLDSEDITDQQRDSSLLIKYNTLKDLIASLWDGKNIYVAEAYGTNRTLRKTPASRPYLPGLITFAKPASYLDPMGMFNGSGFTLKKSGFWVAQGEVHINLATTGPKSNANFGTYEASVTVNGTDWTRALDRQYPQVDEYWHDIVLRPTLMGYMPAGTRLQLRAAQSSNLNQNIATARLALYRVRG